MKRSKKLILIFIIVGLFMAVFFFHRKAKLISRQNRIEDFFGTNADLQWARKFLGRDIDFCTQQWSETDSDNWVSSTGKYQAERPKGEWDASVFVIHDLQEKRIAMTIPSEWPPYGSQLKWILNDRYVLIIRTPSHDDDFVTPRIDIGNLSTGQIIYFVDAIESECR